MEDKYKDIFMEEARQFALECWRGAGINEKENSKLLEAVTRAISAWMDTAAQNDRNTEYYRKLVIECGEALGQASYIADDGKVHSDVLCAKVPELVKSLIHQFKPYPPTSVHGFPTDVKNGDWIMHPGWEHGPVKVVDLNWALGAVAVQLAPKGGIVVWSMRRGTLKVPAPKVDGLT